MSPCTAVIHKNWEAIASANISPHLAAFLVDETDTATLEKVRIAFPEYFSDEETVPAVYTASMLTNIARTKSFEEGNSHDTAEADGALEWSRAFEDGSVPTLDFAKYDRGVPIAIRRQLKGQIYGCGMKVRWKGGDWVVVDISHGLGEIGEPFAEIPDPEVISIAPAAFIRLDR